MLTFKLQQTRLNKTSKKAIEGAFNGRAKKMIRVLMNYVIKDANNKTIGTYQIVRGAGGLPTHSLIKVW